VCPYSSHASMWPPNLAVRQARILSATVRCSQSQPEPGAQLIASILPLPHGEVPEGKAGIRL